MILVFYNSAMSMHYFYNQKFKIIKKKKFLSYLPPKVVLKANMKAELSNSKNCPKMESPGRGYKHCHVTTQTLIRSNIWNVEF